VETPSIVSDACLKQMPYLQAVVCEGLRICPPVTGVVPKKVPKHGDMVSIDGTTYLLTGAKNVGYNAWGVHNSPYVFDEDAGVCRPERWLLEDTDKLGVAKLATIRRTTGMIFGYEKYHCLGKPIAWL
jgi:cytochrome P450